MKHPIVFRALPIVLVLLVVAPLIPADKRTPTHTTRPNIIIIVLDTVRASATSLSRSGSGHTPYLETLAEQGVVFENAFATHDITPESHFSIFSGLKTGFMSKKDRPEHSIAHLLGSIGYDSLGVSANYNVRKQAIRSVRPFHLFISPVSAHLKHFRPDFFQRKIEARAARLAAAYGVPKGGFNRNINVCGAPSVNAVLGALLQHVEQPALIFANFMDAHDPYFPPPDFHTPKSVLPRGFSSDVRKRPLPDWMQHPKTHIADAKRRHAFVKRLKSVSNRRWSLSDDLSEDALAVYEKRYQEEITYLDEQLKTTMTLLASRGLLDNSLLVITSDHGESFGERGYITHAMSNRGDEETSRHVPLVMVPTFSPQDSVKRVRERVSIADIAPTVYELLGVDNLPFIEAHGDNFGKSLLHHLSLRTLGNRRHRITVDETPEAPDDQADQKALIKSLKALGYISDEQAD